MHCIMTFMAPFMVSHLKTWARPRQSSSKNFCMQLTSHAADASILFQSIPQFNSRQRSSDKEMLQTDVIMDQCKQTFQFITQCKDDISHAYKTAKITVFDPIMCKSPHVPLQAGMLALTIQMRTSQPSILAVLHRWEY